MLNLDQSERDNAEAFAPVEMNLIEEDKFDASRCYNVKQSP